MSQQNQLKCRRQSNKIAIININNEPKQKSRNGMISNTSVALRRVNSRPRFCHGLYLVEWSAF